MARLKLPKLIPIFLLFNRISSLCDYERCPDTRAGGNAASWNGIYSCGAVVSEDPINGPKCAHVLMTRDKYPAQASRYVQ